ncbi:MAG: CHAT domain-containing protein [candidate division Zixibacteria bacterium]|nr:CHAT domain-containing protein [candidate division Zixibacteria bacterium]
MRIFSILGFVLLLSLRVGAAESWQDLLNRADSLSKAQYQDSAIFIGRLALEKTREEFGGNDTATARVLFLLGIYHYHKAAYGQADTLLRQAITIREKVLGPNDPDVAKGLNNLALVYCGQGRYVDAEPLYKRVLAIFESAFGIDNPYVAFCVNNLAFVYYLQGRYANAEPLYKRGLAVLEKALGSDNLAVVQSVKGLADIYLAQARNAEAEQLYKRALAIKEKALSPDHPDVAMGLNDLANVYLAQALYAEAEPLYKRALAILEKTTGSDHPRVAAVLGNLAVAYRYQGRDADAEPLYKRALAIREKALGADNPDVSASLNNLANLYSDQAKYAEADQLYKRALAIKEKALGPDHPDVALGLHNLACNYYDQGRYADAEPLYRRALAIDEKVLGPEHPNVARCLLNLALVYHAQGRDADAEPLYKRVLAIDEKVLGPDHPRVADTRGSYSAYYRATQQLDSGIAEAAKAFNIRFRNFRNNARVLSEKDALTYAQAVKKAFNSYLSCIYDLGKADYGQLNEENAVVLSSKGIVFEGVMQRQQALATEKDSITQMLAQSLRTAKLQISKLYSADPGDDTTGAYKIKLDSLSRAANDFEAELSRRSMSFRRRQEINNISAAKIDSLLPANTAFIEYLKWDYRQIKPDSVIPKYLALIINKGGKTEIVQLGDASDIDPLVDRYLKHMQSEASAGQLPNKSDMVEYQPINQALYERIWKPLERHFKKEQTIFVGLDGSLNLVSLAGLMDEKGIYLVEKYLIHHLSSGRDLIRLQEAPAQVTTGLFALGDPDYDATPSIHRVSEALAQEVDSIAGYSEYATHNVRSGCGDLKNLHVASLPGTKSEINQIVSRWRSAWAETTAVFFDSQASEDNFRKEASGKRVIHLATHGYFLEGRCRPSIPSTRAGNEETWVGENPLLQSGLLLAGANRHGDDADSLGVDDGILSAYEVSSLDLKGTQLVVLSACETGLGEVKQGEGVFGLRRAFQMAGARTVVSSLWQVDDKTTAEMMSRLYMRSDKSIPERLRELQLEQIKKLRAGGFSDHPYSWAAFIAQGDWR